LISNPDVHRNIDGISLNWLHAYKNVTCA
jgi:hypothetical protein